MMNLNTLTSAPTLSVNPYEGTWIGSLQEWVEGMPEALQWLGTIAISAIPFIESYFGTFLGMLAGMPWWAALASAVIGNTVAVAVLVYGAHRIRGLVVSRKEPAERTPRQEARRQKAMRLFDKFGVPGVSILGPFALPSQITAPLMVSFGANRNLVMIWMLISIILWGALFVLLGIGFLSLFE